jgi:hypothetical protein
MRRVPASVILGHPSIGRRLLVLLLMASDCSKSSLTADLRSALVIEDHGLYDRECCNIRVFVEIQND